MKGWEHLTQEESLRELRLLSLKIRWLQGDLINLYKYVMGESKEEGARLISEVPSDRTRGNGHKLKHRRLPLNTRKHPSTRSVVELWHRLPREVVESPSLEILKSHLDTVLGSLL